MAEKFRMGSICTRVNDNQRMRLEEISRVFNVPLSVATRTIIDIGLDKLYDSEGNVQIQRAKGFGR